MSRKNKRRRYHNRQNNIEQNIINKNAKLKHFVDKDAEWWIDYDEKGNIIHKKIMYKTPELRGRILEFWIEYNEMGNEIHFTRNDGFQCWSIYNSKGNISKYLDVTGYTEKYTYYRGGIVYKENSYGVKEKFSYTEKDVPLTRDYFN